jgi:hypothetical protein
MPVRQVFPFGRMDSLATLALAGLLLFVTLLQAGCASLPTDYPRTPSMNLDPRSLVSNTEIGVVVEQDGLAATQVEKIDSRLSTIAFRLELTPAAGPGATPEIEWVTTREGQAVRYSAEPMTNAWQRLKIWFYSLLPIEHLL